MSRFGFIGVGNMGGAMVEAMAPLMEQSILLYDVNKSNCEKVQAEHVKNVDSIEELMEEATYIVLTIKPQYYESVCQTLLPYLRAHHVIVTVAPGISINYMKEKLGKGTKIIRTMPNTPALVGCGVTAYCYNKEEINQEVIGYFENAFKGFGTIYLVEEASMEAIVALTGSSPAYGYMFIEAMADAAVKFGIPRTLAYEMAAQTLKGTAQMVLETKNHPGVLKDAVTSPGGTTIEAVVALEANGFRHSIISAMTACYDKAKQMQK